jgi:hypothetical protein
MEWTPIIVEVNTKPDNSHENFKKVIFEILSEFGNSSIKSKNDINTQSNETIFLMYVNSDIDNNFKAFIDKLQYVKRSKIVDNIANNEKLLDNEDLLAIFFDRNKHVGMVCKNYKCKAVRSECDNLS